MVICNCMDYIRLSVFDNNCGTIVIIIQKLLSIVIV